MNNKIKFGSIILVFFLASLMIPYAYAQNTQNQDNNFFSNIWNFLFPTQRDTTPPVVFVSQAKDNNVITISSQASDNRALLNIRIFIDGRNVISCGTGTCGFSSSALGAGNHVYYASATDTSGNTAVTEVKQFYVASPSQAQQAQIIQQNPTSKPIQERTGAQQVTSTPINSCPYTISSPGTYTLSGDLNGADWCITVAASDVVLDGWNSALGRRNKITLSGDNNCGFDLGHCTVHISSGSNIKIKNIDSNGGIRQYGSSSSNIEISNSNLGVGVTVFAGDDVTIVNNTLGGAWASFLGSSCDSGNPAYRLKLINNIVNGTGTNDFMGGPHYKPSESPPNGCLNWDLRWLFENNTFDGSEFYFRYGISNSTIKRNNFIYKQESNMWAGVYLRDGASYDLFENNYFEAKGAPRSALFYSSGNEKQFPRNNTFRNNTFRGIGSGAVVLQAAGPGNVFENNVFWSDTGGVYGNNLMKSTDTVLRHNTIYSQGSGYTAMELANESAIRFERNIIVHSSSSSIFSCTGTGPKAYMTYMGNNNIFYGTAAANICGYNLAGWRTATGDDANSVEANPLFVNAAAGDFRLQAGSPACNLNGDYAGAFPCGGGAPAATINCTDTDSGNYPTINANLNGTVKIRGGGSYPDTCVNSNTLREAYCADAGTFSVSYSNINCPDMCRVVGTEAKCNTKPNVVISANPTTGQAPMTVSFSASGSSDPDGDALTYSWNFGDGQQGTGITANHVYSAVGTYIATLTVNDSLAVDTKTKTITVSNQADITPPVVSVAHSPTSPTAGQTVTITATATDNVGISRIVLRLDGAVVQSCTTSPCSYSNYYSTAGTHTYNATANDTSNNIAKDPSAGTKSFTVSAAAPVTTGKSCGIACAGCGAHGLHQTGACTYHIESTPCSPSASCGCDGTNMVNNINISSASITAGNTITAKIEYGCWDSGDNLALWYYNGTAWKMIHAWAPGSLTGCDQAVEDDTDGTMSYTFTPDKYYGTQYLRAIETWYDGNPGNVLASSSSCPSFNWGNVDDISFNVMSSGGGGRTPSRTEAGMPENLINAISSFFHKLIK